eukprot:CAMPEP_0198310030 /NCGR_PEP_ID=MMETSP1450-20131203/2225_1 /TAXON_ID=753684 ORGANISM="Madagascaria erythrocladiodes, Strain CCMP3234" /NCGR_SAMPLE_ID=MMETSP1450 /ASSEMBLY_ACC=CAM_ASM_001115 /LENGTH=695 /DNA_ID=CAMNT_0044012819 /DNA_START=84 /DNA_END=2171 /DNA_ORIENTATION=+
MQSAGPGAPTTAANPSASAASDRPPPGPPPGPSKGPNAMSGGGAGGGPGGGPDRVVPGIAPATSARFFDLLDQVRNEFESAVQESRSSRGIRDEYHHKVEEQISEISAMEQAISDLERRFGYMKDQYESEIQRLKGLGGAGGAAPPNATPSSSRPPGVAAPSAGAHPGPAPPSASFVPVLGSATGGPAGGNAPPSGSGLPGTQLMPPSQLAAGMGPASKRQRGEPGGVTAGSGPPGSGPGALPSAGLSGSLPSAPPPSGPGVRQTNGIGSSGPLMGISSMPGTTSPPLGPNKSNTMAPMASMPRNGPTSGGPPAPGPGPGPLAMKTTGRLSNMSGPQGTGPPRDTGGAQGPSVPPGGPPQTREEDDYVVYQGRSSSGNMLNINIKLQNTFAHDSVVCCVRYSWNGLYLATGSNKSAHIFDAASGGRVATLSKDDGTDPDHDQATPDSYVRAVCFSPDGNWLITGAEDHVVKVWDVRNRTVKYRLVGHDTDIYSVDASQDGNFIISGSGDKKAKIWSLKNGDLLNTLGGGDYGPSDGITSVSVSPTSQHVAAGSLDNIVRVWDVEAGTLVRSFEGHRDSVYSVAFSPDGRMLLSGSLDKTLKLWDLAANQPSNQCRLSFTGHKDYVLSVAFSPNGRWLISGSKDRTVQFWDPRQSNMCLMLQGHKNSVISIAHAPTNKSLATGSGDCRARTWLYTN